MNDDVQIGSVFDKAKDVFPLAVFHRTVKIILSIILERVDNKEIGQWPFPPGLATGLIVAVFHYSSNFLSVQDWLNKLSILFLRNMAL